MVVPDKAFFITRDGGTSWEDTAPVSFPLDGLMKGFNVGGLFNCFGWDRKGALLYASSPAVRCAA